MDIRMLNSNTALIKNTEHFNLKHTFDCGQCFRWQENTDGSYTGIAFSKAVRMSLNGSDLTIFNTNKDDVENIWINYLDLERDYSVIKQYYSEDIYVSKAAEYGYGIHILNQDIFECLISFILSSQNQIPRIKKIVHTLSMLYGKKCNLDGQEMYAFPTLSELSGVCEGDLAPLKAGYRASYVEDAVKKLSNRTVELECIKQMPYSDAKNELMKIKGIGPKVADCILLFGAGRAEAFPIDVWVKKTMRSLYLDEKATQRDIEFKAKELFGSYAGFAQQYLFYYARENGGFNKI